MANRYWVNGGTGNWNSTTNWSATSGGASGASVPGTSDDVTFDGAGNSASLMTVGYTINSLTVTSGYTSTLTFTTTTVNVNGNVSLGSAMTLTGTGTLRVGYVSNTSVTLNTNGTVIGCNLTIGHASGTNGVTVTLQENALVTGTFTFGQGSNTGDVIINGFNIECRGDVTNSAASSTRISRGTTTFSITGSSSQQLSGTGTFRNNVTINKSGGTLTITSLNYNTGTFAYTAGTVTHTGTITILTSTTFTGIQTWNNVTLGGGGTNTTTLSSSFTISGSLTIGTAGTYNISGAGYLTAVTGTLTLSSSGVIFNPANNMTVGNLIFSTGVATINTYNINVTGSLTTTGGPDGTGSITMTGTGTWSGAGRVQVDLIFNTAGTITVSGSVLFGIAGKTFTYTAGTVITTGSTISLYACNFNSNGIVWNIITPIASGNVITLLSNVTANTLTSSNINSTWNGASYTISISNLNLSAQSTTSVSGTAKIVMTGTGTVSAAHTTGGIAIAYEQNTSGTITYSGAIRFTGANTFTHTQGTTLGGSSTVTFSGTMNINASGLTFNILELDGNATFTSTGSFGWTSSTFQSVTGTHTYKAGATYNITYLLQLIGTAASRIVMLSSSSGTRANFNLLPGGTMTVGYVTSTDIDSSGGISIFDWQGILSNTVNWNILTAPQTVAYTYFV